MLKYLLIPLANDSVSFCHYSKGNKSEELIPINYLKEAIFWAMKENLNIQFIFPDYEIPEEYKAAINTIDHVSVIGSTCEDKSLCSEADIVVFDTWTSINEYQFKQGTNYVIRCSKDELFDNARLLNIILPKVDRLVIVINDIESFKESDFEKYALTLDSLIPIVKEEYKNGHTVHFNLLTDRIILETMNNCNAGHESITIAPDGNFYICPAFYLDGSKSVGNLKEGLDIKNQQLYRLDHAPICHICDAYQCRRCVWLNKKTTLEVNTPSHEQCVIAHIERNASKKLLDSIRELGEFLPKKSIKKIEYLDPFDNLTK